MSLEFNEILELIEKVDKSSIDEVTIESGHTKLSFKKKNGVSQLQAPLVVEQRPVAQAAPVVAPKVETTETPKAAPAADKSNLVAITAPMVGTFYASASPESDAFVTVGSKVDKNTTVCILEAMKLFNEINAEVEGEIVEVLAKNGQLVEYGQVLFYVKP